MEKYLVIANFACQSYCEDDLYASQWPVGTFATVEESVEASLQDLFQVGRDHYECIVDDADFEMEAEYDITVDDKARDYCAKCNKPDLDAIKSALLMHGHSEFLWNDFVCKDTNTRQITKYTIYKITVKIAI